ncbi:PIN domain-containing protein [Candidatus Woesearchaeota archaeon]|nr:PIN domain-containing protein [Candidatus Woesearchaeota archaeon]
MYFFDTYALFELIKGNRQYDKYKGYALKVCVLNIAELYWGLIKDVGMEESDKWLQKYKFEIITIDYNLILSAVKFRYEHKKQDISLTDSIGYLLAKKYGLKFLTGDKEFENFPNVEFVK